MVWDYPEALEVIRSEQAAGCVAAVLCGHAACYSKCRAPSCYPSLLPHPATPSCYPGLLGWILQRGLAISDPALLKVTHSAEATWPLGAQREAAGRL